MPMCKNALGWFGCSKLPPSRSEKSTCTVHNDAECRRPSEQEKECVRGYADVFACGHSLECVQTDRVSCVIVISKGYHWLPTTALAVNVFCCVSFESTSYVGSSLLLFSSRSSFGDSPFGNIPYAMFSWKPTKMSLEFSPPTAVSYKGFSSIGMLH